LYIVIIIESGDVGNRMHNVVERSVTRGNSDSLRLPPSPSCVGIGDALVNDSATSEEVCRRGEREFQISNFEVQIDENCVQLSIKHRLFTTISDVGLQLWRAAFLIVDFLVDQKAHFRTRSIVELGCGVGLVGVVVNLLNHRGAYITDINENILSLAHENLSLNASAVTSAKKSGGAVSCRVLDWASEALLTPSVLSDPEGSWTDWTREDIELLNSTRTLFVAADCVYDDDLTKLLFLTASKLMKPRDRMVIAIEKRYVSSFESGGDIDAYGYAVFLRHLNRIPGMSSLTYESPHYARKRVKVAADQLDHASLPQYITPYTRSNEMELWEIWFEPA
jgi:predicted RNA methylase